MIYSKYKGLLRSKFQYFGRSFWKAKQHVNVCLILKGYQDRPAWTYKYRSMTNVKKKEKLLIPDFTLIFIKYIMTSLLQKDELVTIHYNCSKKLPSKWMHFEICVRRARVVRLSWFLRQIMSTATSKTLASKSSRVSTFLLYTYFFSPTHKHKSNEQSTQDSNSYISVTIHHYANIHTNFHFITVQCDNNIY